MAVAVAIAWPMVGFAGWTFGSFIEVTLSTPLYSTLYVLGRSVRWLVVGTAEGVILAITTAVSPAFDAPGDGPSSTQTTRRARAALFGLCAAFWVSASAIGGLLVEGWAALDVAARTNRLNGAVGELLQNLGVAENVAYVVVPYAIFVPILYGVPTGLAFLAIYRAVRRAT